MLLHSLLCMFVRMQQTTKGVALTYDGSCSFTSTYDPAVEYGTANITVNGEKVDSNVKQETSN